VHTPQGGKIYEGRIGRSVNEQPQGRALRYRRFNLEIFAYAGEQISRTPSMNRIRLRLINTKIFKMQLTFEERKAIDEIKDKKK
jgi:hypothetical protein